MPYRTGGTEKLPYYFTNPDLNSSHIYCAFADAGQFFGLLTAEIGWPVS